MIRAAALALALLACGGRPRSPSPTVVDAAPDAAPSPDAAPADPATATLLEALAEQRDRACACGDVACAEDAAALAVQWGLDHPDVVRAAAPSPDEERVITEHLEAAEACLDRWLGGH